MSRPRYLKYGEPWFDCHICGFSYPVSQGLRHYRSKKFVDAKCMDEPSHADNQEFSDWANERQDVSPQRVIS